MSNDKEELSAAELLQQLQNKITTLEEASTTKDSIAEITTTQLMEVLSARLRKIGVPETAKAIDKYQDTKKAAFELNQFFHEATQHYR